MNQFNQAPVPLNVPDRVTVLENSIGTVPTGKTIEGQIGEIKSDIGIVEDTDTAVHAISSGQYVIWKGNLYKAKSAITAGTTLSASNLDAVSNGIANELNSKITDYIVVEEVGNNSVNVTADTVTNVSLPIPAKTGYKAVGIVGFGIWVYSESKVQVRTAAKSGNNVNIVFVSNQAKNNANVYAEVLYVRNL